MSFYSEYWEKFLESLNKKESFPLAAKKSAGDKNWIHWECFGQKGFKLIVSLDQNSDWICVNFGIDKRDQKYKFDTLKKNMGQINKNSGLDLRWDPLGKERSNTQAILTKYGVDIHNRSKWAEQHDWMLVCLEKMYFAFKPQVDCLQES